MPPHGHGVKDNEENQSCSNASLDHLRLDHTSSGCGIGSRLRGTLQIRFQIVRQVCNTTTPPLNKQTNRIFIKLVTCPKMLSHFFLGRKLFCLSS